MATLESGQSSEFYLRGAPHSLTVTNICGCPEKHHGDFRVDVYSNITLPGPQRRPVSGPSASETYGLEAGKSTTLSFSNVFKIVVTNIGVADLTAVLA